MADFGVRPHAVPGAPRTRATAGPGAPTIPAPGTRYELPACPEHRAGVALNAACDSVTVRGNLIRDSGSGTQTRSAARDRQPDRHPLGFLSHSRFTAHYRSVFGIPPSRTLHG
ncbi:hypothetical protein ACFWDN_07205 [Micromonospora chalcea]